MKLKYVGIVLVLVMAMLQAFYAVYAYLDPTAFSVTRGTVLFEGADSDWVRIYASRTLFIALVVGFLLYKQSFQALIWVAIFGLVMPVTDAVLAYQAGAPIGVVAKHIAIAIYLSVTAFVLKIITQGDEAPTRN